MLDRQTVLIIAMLAYAIGSAVCFVMYGLDKRAAKREHRRTPEATLHIAELLFGWPGALVAQRVFHHKTRKRSFLVITWAIVLLHTATWAILFWKGVI